MQSRGDGAGSGSSRRKPSRATRYVGSTGPLARRAFLLGTRSAAGESLERRLCILKREDRRAGFARRSAFILPASRKSGCDRSERLSTAAFPRRRRASLVPAAKPGKDAAARLICGGRDQGRGLWGGD